MRVLRQRARKQAALLTQIERLGDRVTAALVKNAQKKAIAALRSHGRVQFSPAERNRMTSELADLMLLGFVRRYRQEKNALGIELNLSFSREVAKIAKGFDLDLDGIWDSFAANARPRVDTSVASIEERINKAIGEVTARQQPKSIATNELRRRLDDMGLSARRPTVIETLVRTHAQISFNSAQFQLERNDPEQLITGYQYTAIIDDRTRPEHEEMDGVVFAKDDPELNKWWPPNGWNCRCQMVSLTDPVESSKLPRGVEPDDGFDFGPADILGEAA
jgi:SPP1 gp7 family putative phage head morphogenesis protein